MKLLVKIYLYHLYFRLRWLITKIVHDKDAARHQANTGQQLFERYQSVAGNTDYKEKMRNRECQVFSQNGEDGLLLYILSQVGISNKTFVEFGMETGRECNLANLAINFGWNGLFMDGGEKNIASARKYYQSIGRFETEEINIQQCFVTTKNINSAITNFGITGEIDVLSIDIDGNDYWIWQSIDCINPRLAIVEYNASFGSERSITVNYDPAFSRYQKHRSGWYHGASLSALTKLGKEKGYQLVCADSKGCNAFFVRNDVIKGDLEEITPAEAFYPQPKRGLMASLDQQFELIEQLNYTEI